MALNGFIPTLWAAGILSNLNKEHIYGQAPIVNRNYEGEIRQAGDTVKINSIGRVTVFDYVKNTNMPAPETLTEAQKILVINVSKAFNFQVDDIDQAQSSVTVMNEATAEAAYSLNDLFDSFVASFYVDATSNLGTTLAPIQLTTATAYDQLVELSVKLDEQRIPGTGRWVVVPPWVGGVLRRDTRMFSNIGDGQVITNGNGYIGQVAGLSVYMSLNVPQVTSGAGGTPANTMTFKIMAGHSMGISVAEQIVQTEAYRPELRFGDALKGLHVYGGKVIRPEALAVLHAYK